MKLSDHPTVQAYKAGSIPHTKTPEVVEAGKLKKIAMEIGVDDAGIIDLSRDTMAPYREDLIAALPGAQSVMVLAFRVNQQHLRSTTHSIADHEFKQVWMAANHMARELVKLFRRMGIKAVNMPAGFPYESTRWPGKMWLTCDKVFAVEAGLGRMGYNRLVLHPKFGAAVILESILLSSPCAPYDRPVEYNPCIECGLCLKVCPVGAVKKTDDFNFMACYSHNYRERLGGFLNWVEQVVESKDCEDYRSRVSDSETVSMWQHLAIGAQTRCDRCMAVCPAGEENIGEYLDDRKSFVQHHLKKFTNLAETIYVVKGSDAEQHVKKNFPAKQTKVISNGIRPASAEMFLNSLPLIFQPGQSEGIDATYHFTFTGEEELKGTVGIREKTLNVQQGHVGEPNLHVTADSRTWIQFLAKEVHLAKALITRKIKLKGSPKLMLAFAKCFPS